MKTISWKSLSWEWFLYKDNRTEILKYASSNLKMRIILFTNLEMRKNYSLLQLSWWSILPHLSFRILMIKLFGGHLLCENLYARYAKGVRKMVKKYFLPSRKLNHRLFRAFICFGIIFYRLLSPMIYVCIIKCIRCESDILCTLETFIKLVHME